MMVALLDVSGRWMLVGGWMGAWRDVSGSLDVSVAGCERVETMMVGGLMVELNQNKES